MARKIAVFRERFKNACLTNVQRTRLYVIDESVRFVQIFGGPYPSSAPLNNLREWIDGMESGKLVLATLATERLLKRWCVKATKIGVHTRTAVLSGEGRMSGAPVNLAGNAGWKNADRSRSCGAQPRALTEGLQFVPET